MRKIQEGTQGLEARLRASALEYRETAAGYWHIDLSKQLSEAADEIARLKLIAVRPMYPIERIITDTQVTEMSERQEGTERAPTEEEMRAALNRMKESLRKRGENPDVLTVRGALLMQPEPRVRFALEALDRIEATLLGVAAAPSPPCGG